MDLCKLMNLEIKYYCNDFAPLREVLSGIGVHCEGVFEQEDYYFNLPDNNPEAKLKYRIEGDNRTLIFYTRPSFKNGESSECEFKFVQDREGILFEMMKEALGVKAVVRKKREAWRNGPAIFHLDQVETVGSIFEIEYETEDPKKDENIFQKLLERCRPFLGVVAISSNADLVMEA